MDTIIYLTTALLAVIWSVQIYLNWHQKAGLAEDSGWRFFLIIAPSSYFLLTALAAWEKALYIRLDIIGLIIIDLFTLICWAALVIIGRIRHINFRKNYIRILLFYNIFTILLVTALHIIKYFPPLLIPLTNLATQGQRLDFFRFGWLGLDPETHDRDLVSMLNKILIALLSYLPIAFIRALLQARQRRRIVEQLNLLRRRIEELEQSRD
jgi:hypothetical protein